MKAPNKRPAQQPGGLFVVLLMLGCGVVIVFATYWLIAGLNLGDRTSKFVNGSAPMGSSR